MRLEALHCHRQHYIVYNIGRARQANTVRCCPKVCLCLLVQQSAFVYTQGIRKGGGGRGKGATCCKQTTTKTKTRHGGRGALPPRSRSKSRKGSLRTRLLDHFCYYVFLYARRGEALNSSEKNQTPCSCVFMPFGCGRSVSYPSSSSSPS